MLLSSTQLILQNKVWSNSRSRQCVSVSTCFYTNVNAWVYTCVCERACVHKVPPCKCLIVCVGNNSPIPQGMKQARKRPGPQTSRDPQGTGPPGEPPQGQPRPPPRKGQRRARRRDLRQPQCRRPRVPWRQARRLHRQPTTPGRTGPWARRPKGPPPHNRGPARPVGPGPANRPPRVGRRSPEHPAPAREITNAPAASSTGRAWWWGGGRLRWWVRQSLRPDLTHRRRRQAHIYTSICSHPHARKRIFTPSPHM